MTRRQIFKKISFTFILICLTVSTPTHAQNLGLVDLLTGQLGITKDQASGGAGSIFQLAKQNLNVEDFSGVAKAVPGIDQMMGAAPKVEGSSSTLGGISSMLGSSSKKVGGIAGLTGSFEKLGLSGDMVDKFIPIILDYVKKSGGENVMSLLKGALL
jgi:hypothetical protein